MFIIAENCWLKIIEGWVGVGGGGGGGGGLSFHWWESDPCLAELSCLLHINSDQSQFYNLVLDKTIQESLQSQNKSVSRGLFRLSRHFYCLRLKLCQFINQWTLTLFSSISYFSYPEWRTPGPRSGPTQNEWPHHHSGVTLDDVQLDAGRGGVVWPALVLPAVVGADGLEEERDDRHLGLVHQQTHAGLVGGDLRKG